MPFLRCKAKSFVNVETAGLIQPHTVGCLQSLIDDEVIASAWYADEIGSTNSQAIANIRSNSVGECLLPRLYLTDRQTAGRGRRGRRWLSDPANLAISIVLNTVRLQPELQKLQSIAVGVAIAQGIEHEFAPIRTQLKWPNDIWIDGGKVGGILIERVSTFGNYLVVGIGLNVETGPTHQDMVDDNQIGSITPAKSIASAVGRLMDVQNELLSEPHEILAEFRRRCVLTEKNICFSNAGVSQQGRCLGINDDGSLSINRDGQPISVESGEASLIRF